MIDPGVQRLPPDSLDRKQRDMENEAKIARAKKKLRREKRHRLWSRLTRRESAD